MLVVDSLRNMQKEALLNTVKNSNSKVNSNKYALMHNKR